jgi:aspartyl/glutamyl-tRNA(Asn/Gln) amidotransferase C subunit
MEAELNALLSWVEQLQEVDVEGVPPMTSVVEQRLKMRDDVVNDGGYADDLLKNAPQVEDQFLRCAQGGRVMAHAVRSDPIHTGRGARRTGRESDLRARAGAGAYRRNRAGAVAECLHHRDPDRALAAATQSDAKIADGDARPLEGIPLAVKDLFCTNGVRTTAASRILDNFVPTYESAVTRNLWNAGASCWGKTNSTNSRWGRPTRRPISAR